MKRMLITGGSGLLGNSLITLFKNSFEVSATYFKNKTRNINGVEVYQLDLRDKYQVNRLINQVHPDVLIHAAGMTNVDECELNPELAYELNVEAIENLVESIRANKNESLFVYISTDFVYKGDRGNYCECEPLSPINVYGKTKYEGEIVVRESGLSSYLIFRTCFWGIGPDNGTKSFANAIIHSLKNNKVITPFHDQYFSPISTYYFGKILEKILAAKSMGAYNCATKSRISKYDFAKLLSFQLGYKESLIQPISFQEGFKNRAPRPRDSSMNMAKLEKEMNETLLDINSDIQLTLQHFKYLK